MKTTGFRAPGEGSSFGISVLTGLSGITADNLSGRDLDIAPDGSFTIKPPASKAGDNIVLRADMDAFIVVSACPQDQNDTCGGTPTDIRVEVGR